MDLEVNLLIPMTLVVLPVFYVSGFLHEVGHAVMGRLCGYVVTSFGMGLGRPLFVGRCGTARVYVCLAKPFQGITFVFNPLLFPPRWRAAGMLAGGMIANALLTLVGLGLWRLLGGPEWLWLTVVMVNGFMTLVNGMPLAFPVGQTVLRSDGAQILAVLLGRGGAGAGPFRIRTARALRPLWQAVGDSLGLWAHLLDAALAWRELGDAESARELLAEAEALPVELTPPARAFLLLVRAAVRAPADPAAGAAAFDEAEEAFRALGRPEGLFLTAWLRAEARLRAGDAVGADAALAELEQNPVAASRPVLQLGLLADRLSAAAARGDGDAVMELAEVLRRRQAEAPSLVREMQKATVLARYHAARQELPRAREHYLAALRIGSQLNRLFADADDQARFRRSREPLVAEAAQVLRQTGLAEQAERIEQFFPTPEQVQKAQEELRRRRDLQNLVRGVTLALVNLILTVLGAVLWVHVFLPPSYAEDRRLAALSLTALLIVGGGAVLTLLVGGVVALLRRAVPLLQRGGGGLVLYLALLPWLSAFFVALAVLFFGDRL